MEQLLDRIRDANQDAERVSVGQILEGVGERSFGPVVLLAGLITTAPLIGDIPGVPTLLALVVLLTVGQLLFRRRSIWLPGWITHREVPRDKLVRGVEWLRKPARFMDRWTGPRLVYLVDGAGKYVMALMCMAVALVMPAMEMVPFTATAAGLALSTFGLALVARDGIVALVAVATTGLTFWFVYNQLVA